MNQPVDEACYICKGDPAIEPFCSRCGAHFLASMSTSDKIRPKGKSRMNEMVREQFAAMGMKPCPHCGVPGKWDIFHPPDKPCPKQQSPDS